MFLSNSSNFFPICVLDCTYPFSKITYILAFPFISLKQYLVLFKDWVPSGNLQVVLNKFSISLWKKRQLSTEELMFWIVVLEKTLESPLGSKEITPVNPKGNQPWIFIERADAEALIFCSPDAKIWLIGKDPEAGEDGRQEEKGAMEDEMVGWQHQLNGNEF